MSSWTPKTTPPPTCEPAAGWPWHDSKDVLGLLKNGPNRWQAVLKYQVDADSGEATWRTCCSESWDVTQYVEAWQDLPPYPTEEI
jgi:hypothetical protein